MQKRKNGVYYNLYTLLKTKNQPLLTITKGFHRSTIAEKVKELIVKQLAVAPDQVTDDARFVEDLNADSLDIVELIMALEEEFSSEIPDDEAENLKTVGDAIKYIESKTAAAKE